MADSSPVPEPPDTLTDTRELLLGYLDHYRSALLRKLDGMPEDDLRTSRLPSGWTPLGLLKHLAYVERRWFRWGFAAERVDDVDGDRDPGSGRWRSTGRRWCGSCSTYCRSMPGMSGTSTSSGSWPTA